MTTRQLVRFFSLLGFPIGVSIKKFKKACWPWLGYVSKKNGYAQYLTERRLIHRISYQLFIGPIPRGKKLDHLCRVRHCGNPFHLEPVTTRVNILRGISFSAVNAKKKSCLKGHPFAKENTRIVAGRRICKICQRGRIRKWRAAHREDLSSRRRMAYAENKVELNKKRRMQYARSCA